jgi:hypothetical protein
LSRHRRPGDPLLEFRAVVSVGLSLAELVYGSTLSETLASLRSPHPMCMMVPDASLVISPRERLDLVTVERGLDRLD